LEAAKATFKERVKAVRNLETILNDHQRLDKIAAVKAELQPEEANDVIWENLTEQEIEQVAALQTRNNQFPPKSSSGPSSNNGQACNSSASNPNIICRYCDKKGHCQKECFFRQRNNAPMVDATGKPYEYNHVNNVADKSANHARQPEAVYKDAHIRSVANLTPYHHLNW
jgi:hypothetical protein